MHVFTLISYRNGVLPPPEVTTTPFGSIASTLDTGDVILFSGATSSGAIIKFFDRSQFSHVGLVSSIMLLFCSWFVMLL